MVDNDVVWQAEYEPYGRIFAMRTGNVTDEPLRLPGQEAVYGDEERSYNIFRWYRPEWSRYTQADPLGLQEDEMTLYSYAERNPLLITDETGLVALAPGQPPCRGFERALRRLQKLKTNCKCRDFFGGQFGQSLSNLIDDQTLTVTLVSSGDGETTCATNPNGFTMNRAYCGRLQGGWFGGSTLHVVLHEMAHVADCRVGNYYPGTGTVEEGIHAEIACFGHSIDLRKNPGTLGPPRFMGPWR